MNFAELVVVHNRADYTDQVYAPVLYGFTDADAADTFYADALTEAERLQGSHEIRVGRPRMDDLPALTELLRATLRAEEADPRLYDEDEEMPDTVPGLLAALEPDVRSPDGPPFPVSGEKAVQDAAFLLGDDGVPFDD